MFDIRKNTPAIVGTSAFWIALFVAYALFTQRQPQPQPIAIIPDAQASPAAICPETATPASTPTPAPLRIYVSGAVHEAGVYRLPPNSLVVDAIEMAGGATDEADLIAINLAQPLQDGEQIHVPHIQAESPTPAPITMPQRGVIAGSSLSGNESAQTDLIDINTASQEELESLPGIGPAMAQRIIEGRPYNKIDDLLNVKGIGEAKLEKLRPYVTVH